MNSSSYPGQYSNQMNSANAVTPYNSNYQSSTSMSSSSYPTMTGSVIGVSGNVARIQLPNGAVKDVTLSQAALNQLNLKRGIQVNAMMMPNGTLTLSPYMAMNPSTGMDMAQNSTTAPINTTGLNIAPGETVVGTINSIDNDGNITLTMPNGQLRNISINRELRQGQNLTPGMRIAVTRSTNGLLSLKTNVPADQMATLMTSPQVIRGTITNVTTGSNGDQVTVLTTDGQTQTFTVDPALVSSLNLQNGTPIVARMMSDGTTTVSLDSASAPYNGTYSNNQTTVTRSTTTTTYPNTPTETVTPTAPTTTTSTTDTTQQTAPATTNTMQETAPVRARW
jgi:molybdopterin-binding protein